MGNTVYDLCINDFSMQTKWIFIILYTKEFLDLFTDECLDLSVLQTEIFNIALVNGLTFSES